MNKTKIFLLSFILISSKLFTMENWDEAQRIIEQMHDQKELIDLTYEDIEKSFQEINFSTHQNVKQDDKNLFITLIAIVDDPKKDIEINISDYKLIVNINGKFSSLNMQITDDSLNYLIIVSRAKKLCDNWSLPSVVDIDSVKSSYEKGILTITLPKKEQIKKKPKKIDVEIK
ncbi:Hsp20 family protein [Candidatus Dependentiae bacterium]|nr:Hsp20 family protein [Candidatus Dependentiae bacterium]